MSGTQSGMSFLFDQTDDQSVLRRYSRAPLDSTACACSVVLNCPDPAWSGGQFLCQQGNNCTAGTVTWSIPGLVTSCTTLDTILNSDLRCFYNQSCFKTLLSMFNVDMPNRLPLPSSISGINMLDTSKPSKFSPKDTIGTIYDQLMVEQWLLLPNHGGYYGACAPAVCTYAVSERIDVLYFIATLFGVIGGLAVTLHLLVSAVAQLVQWLLLHCPDRQGNGTDQQSKLTVCRTHSTRRLDRFLGSGMGHWLRIFVSKLKQRSTIPTCIYMVALIASVVILAVFNASTEVTISQTVPSPSLVEFEQFQVAHPTALSCPCQQLSVPYRTFLSMVPTFHQVCTSAFIGTAWATVLYGYDYFANSAHQSDQPLLSKHLQILGWLCQEAHSFLEYKLSSFRNTTLVSAYPLSREAFLSIVDTATRQFIPQVTSDFARTIGLTTELFQSNMLPTAFNIDWSLEYGNELNGYLLRSVPRAFGNSGCNCAGSGQCRESLRLDLNDSTLPGLAVGCSPISGLRMSTLECFFSSSCITALLNFTDYYTGSSGLSSIVLLVLPMNSSTPSRFAHNESIGTLIDSLFIETVPTSTSYEKYFVACAPSACHYEYIIKRNDTLRMTTIVLGLLGGLAIFWRFIVYNAAKLCRSENTNGSEA